VPRTVFLVCNAHLDPVWQWEWEEGAAEALSTFRVAADLCEEYDGFVFNHNEAILYQWVQEYEPALFARIQGLVKAGRWHIMGGWFLQPDCNMPSGESFVRQILYGKTYFRQQFDVEPTTSINFDPFGHTRGLVQILRKSGYDSYLFCRPDNNDCPLPAEDFLWVGYDGSEVIGHRAEGAYLSPRGQAAAKVQRWLDGHPEKQEGLVLWGVGNHGGGPSRIDLDRLAELISNSDTKIEHATPEAYFARLCENGTPLPRHEGDLNAWAVGCYTSQVRIKQRHRQLENEQYLTEKMASHAALTGLFPYPKAEIDAALYDLLFAEFHDILPGSSVQPVEEMSLRLMDHGLEILSRVKTRAFFALSTGQPVAAEGKIPILVYNPHPFPVTGIFECEFMLADQNWKDEFTLPVVHAGGRRIPSQAEKELSNLNLDWRKRTVFRATLQPGQMNRFDCTLKVLPQRPQPQLEEKDGQFTFATDELQVTVNTATGLIDRYCTGGVEYLRPNAFLPLVIEDNDDPWGMTVQQFRTITGQFRLATPQEAARIAGVKAPELAPVRVIEDGDVRAVIEAIFVYGNSFLVNRYKLPRQGMEIEVEVRVLWTEKSAMLKLAVPTTLADGNYLGQVAYGREVLPATGKEVVAQKWTAVVSEIQAFSCINDGIYGSDCADGEMRLSLLRSAAYAGHPIMDRPIVPQDRFTARIDQGERLYHFWFTGSPATERLEHIEREALSHNERPVALSFFPSGAGETPAPLVELRDDTVVLTAFKESEDGQGYIVRLFNPTSLPHETILVVPTLGINHPVSLGKFEIKSLRIDLTTASAQEVDLLERS